MFFIVPILILFKLSNCSFLPSLLSISVIILKTILFSFNVQSHSFSYLIFFFSGAFLKGVYDRTVLKAFRICAVCNGRRLIEEICREASQMHFQEFAKYNCNVDISQIKTTGRLYHFQHCTAINPMFTKLVLKDLPQILKNLKVREPTLGFMYRIYQDSSDIIHNARINGILGETIVSLSLPHEDDDRLLMRIARAYVKKKELLVFDKKYVLRKATSEDMDTPPKEKVTKSYLPSSSSIQNEASTDKSEGKQPYNSSSSPLPQNEALTNKADGLSSPDLNSICSAVGRVLNFTE